MEKARDKRAIDVYELVRRSRLVSISFILDKWCQLYRDALDTLYTSEASIQSLLELDYSQFIAAIEFLYPNAVFSADYGVKSEEYDNVVFAISRGKFIPIRDDNESRFCA